MIKAKNHAEHNHAQHNYIWKQQKTRVSRVGQSGQEQSTRLCLAEFLELGSSSTGILQASTTWMICARKALKMYSRTLKSYQLKSASKKGPHNFKQYDATVPTAASELELSPAEYNARPQQ